MNKTITVGISDLKIAKAPDVLVTYALGSCVGICMYDQSLHIGGLSHIMLPTNTAASGEINTYKFADTAIVALVKKLERMGGNKMRFKAKIAGGAQMFAAMSNSSIANIGKRNVVAVKNVLSGLKIPIVAEDTGKNYGRTLYFNIEDLTMKIKSGNKGEWIW